MTRTRIVSTLIMLSIIFGSASLLPIQSVIAAGCTSTNCNGYDPIDMACADSRTYTAHFVDVVMAGTSFTTRVELRWSPTCQTNWAKASVSGTTNSSPTLEVELRRSDGSRIEGTYPNGTHWTTYWREVGRGAYGNMAYGNGIWIKACANITYEGRSYAQRSQDWACTALG